VVHDFEPYVLLIEHLNYDRSFT